MKLNEDIFLSALRIKQRFSVDIPSSDPDVDCEVTEPIVCCTLVKSLAPFTPPTCVEVKKMWIYTFISSYVFMAWCLMS
jgi:hypothetical protein